MHERGRWWVCALGAAAMCLPGPARAQDMVFGVEETEGSPLPVDGPPSEALANALRLYAGERYEEAAALLARVVQGETDDAPAQVEKAQLFLAKSLFHLGYLRGSLALFDEITAAGPSHRYFTASLPWLAQLATELPEPAGIIELVGRFDDAQVADLDRPETADVHAQLSYLAGRHAYAQADLDGAIARLERVPPGSPLYARARFFAGVTRVRQRRARPAIEAFREVLRAVDRGGVPEPERMRSLAWLSLGRVYYTAANQTDPETGERRVDATLLENASAAFDRVDPSSELWLDAMFEQSWALYLGQQESRAMGNVHALFSPYFEDADYPEALVLKAVVFFGACQLDNAEAMVRQFHDRYDAAREEAAAALGGLGANEQAYAFLAELHSTEGRARISPRLQRAARASLSDRDLLRHLAYVRVLDAERARLDAASEAFRGSAAADRVRQEVSVARAFAVDRAGELTRARLQRRLDELDELMTQIDTVELETYRVRREGLGSRATQSPSPSNGLDVAVDEEHQVWPFEGEYWRDELPYFRQQVTSRCTR